MSRELKLGTDNEQELYMVSRALASEVRIQIIKLLDSSSLNINEIAEKLKIPPSTAALHIKILEKSGLINTVLQTGSRGSMKLCRRKKDSVTISLKDSKRQGKDTISIDMPIGSYVDFKVEPTCGIVNENNYLGPLDDPRTFYYSNRFSAQLIWTGSGYIEYKFPNNVPSGKTPQIISISSELCSEVQNYKNDWPSDITLWINDVDCGTWTCPGDFGDRRGKLNPSWWDNGLTQYGILKTWEITSKGAFIDEVNTANVVISDLEIMKSDFIKVRIGNKPNAKNNRGFNIFGEHFGEHPQGIVMRIDY